MPQTCAAVQRRFPDWRVWFDDRQQVYCAERRAGTSLRFVAGHEVPDLAAKLARIEAETAAQEQTHWVAANSGPDYKY